MHHAQRFGIHCPQRTPQQTNRYMIAIVALVGKHKIQNIRMMPRNHPARIIEQRNHIKICRWRAHLHRAKFAQQRHRLRG